MSEHSALPLASTPIAYFPAAQFEPSAAKPIAFVALSALVA